MKKVIFAAIAVFSLLFSTAAWAGEFRDMMEALAQTGVIIDQANQDTNNHYTETNEAGKARNIYEVTRGQAQGIIFDELEELGLPLYTITWGDPHGGNKGVQERYVGYTAKNEDFTNPAFPHDAWAGGVLEDRNWISEPWKNIPDQQQNKYDGKQKYYDSITTGALLYYGDVVSRPKARPDFWNNLSSYVHVLAPPTTYTWGMGRIWHQTADGSIWYLSVPLLPHIMTNDNYVKHADVSVKIEPPEKEAQPGEEITFTATLKLKQAPAITINGKTTAPGRWFVWATANHEVSGKPYPVSLEPLDGAPKFDQNYKAAIFEEGKDYKYKLTVHAQNISSLVKLFAEPFAPFRDVNPADNNAKAEVRVQRVNLKVTSIALDPNPGTPNRPTSGVITVRNNSDKAFTATKTIWRVRHSDGSVLDENTIVTDLAPGESKQLPLSFTPDIADTYSVAAMINPDHDNPINEINLLCGDWPGDNRVEVSYRVEEPCTDISVSGAYSHPAGTRYVGHNTEVGATIARANDGPDGPVDVTVTVSGPDFHQTKTISLGRGQSQKVVYIVTVNQPGQATFTFRADPVGIKDCSPGNNSATVSFNVKQMPGMETPESGTTWSELTDTK